MSDVKTKPKPKRKVERYTFGDDVVELRQVDPDRREAPPDSHMFGPAQRSKWEIYINDVHRGFAFYPLGVGNDWVVTTLEPKDIYQYSFLDKAPVRCWKGPTGPLGGWNETGGMWDGLLGLLRRVKPLRDVEMGYEDESVRWKDRPMIAEGFLKCFKQGIVLSPEQIEAKIAKRKQEIIDRKRKDAEDTARYARERAEAEARRQREAAEAEERRQETLAGLESILETKGGTLSNLEMTALTRAIEAYTR